VKQYEFKMKCEVIKIVIVEVEDDDERESNATENANNGDWVDERDVLMPNWEIISGPKDIT
jgi:hypothetical protein